MVRKRLDRRRFVGLLTAATTAGLAGCNGGQDGAGTEEDVVGETDTADVGETETTPQAGSEESFVRVVHAVPDGPNVDVYVDDEPVLEGIAFRTVSEYLPVSAGDHDVQIVAAGEGGTATESETGGGGTETETDVQATETETEMAGGDEETLFDDQVTVPSDTPLTLVALGETSEETVDVRTFEDRTTEAEEQTAAEDTTESGGGATTTDGAETPGADATLVETTISEEETTGEGTSGDDGSSLRLLHASPDAPSVDVAVDGAETPQITGVGFASASDYVSVSAGSHSIDVRAAGETDTLVTGDVETESGTPYTAFAMGYVRTDESGAEQALDLTLATDTTGTANEGETVGDSGETDEGGTETTAEETDASADIETAAGTPTVGIDE